MKLKLILTCSAFMLAMNLLAGPIDVEKAKQLAAEFMPDQSVQPQLVKKAARKKTLAKRIAAKYETSAPYYIFSRGEGQGFVIVSGDDALPSVLGYTEQGDYDEDNCPPFITWYLNYYAQAVEAAQAAEAPAATSTLGPLKVAANRVDIAPLIQTHWHQSSPYNDKCPLLKSGGRSATGCVATAASQVAYYWHKDLTHETLAAVGSVSNGSEAYASTAFPKGTQLKWELMRTQYGSEPDEYKDAVATLVAVIGGGAGLTYGSSTSGHNDKCINVFSNVLGMYGGTDNAKDWGQDYNNYSDDAWSTLLYNELIKKHPILYSGCNANGDGHAVVCDGYQAKTGYFHFNIGWGNPDTYDGYFTVARGQSPSWGFNDSWQECVTGVYPKKQNLKAEIAKPANVYMNRTNEITITVKNEGTLDYSGIYLFANTTGNKSASVANAQDKDIETNIVAGGDAVKLKLTAKPTTAAKWYFIVTDKNLNVLAKLEQEVVTPTSDLWLKSLSLDGSSDTEVHNGKAYSVVYNTKATALADIQDKSEIGYEGNPRMAIYESTDDGKNFAYVGYKSGSVSIDPKGTSTASFIITSTTSCPIKVGNLYYGVLISPIVGTHVSDVLNKEEAKDTIVYFTLKGASDMAVESYKNGCLKLKGNWDVNAFTALAKKTSYKNATSYDLTDVQKIANLPVPAANPNALYYVSNDAKVSGNNYVKGNVCYNLNVTPGYTFAPKEDMTAESATMNINQVADKWGLITVPFDAEVPNGIIARQIDSHASSGISNKTTNVRKLEAGHTYEIMTSSSKVQTLTGKNVKVSKSVVANPDTAVVGTYSNITTPTGAMLINDAEAQWFEPVDAGTPVDALRGYFYAKNVTKTFRAYSSIAVDPSYLTLAEDIELAYQTIDTYRASESSIKALTQLIDSAEIVFTERTSEAVDVRTRAQNLVDAIEDFIKNGSSRETSEVDCTDSISNNSFETSSTAGWTTTGLIKRNSDLASMTVDCDGSYFLGCSKGASVSQTLNNLKPGYYRVEALVGAAEGDSITLFAGDLATTVAANTLGIHYFNEASVEDVYVDNSGTLQIGAKANNAFKVDNFRLIQTQADETGLAEDVNGDGSVDSQDVLKIYEYMKTSTSESSAGASEDVNGDGNVDSQDVLKIYEYMKAH